MKNEGKLSKVLNKIIIILGIIVVFGLCVSYEKEHMVAVDVEKTMDYNSSNITQLYPFNYEKSEYIDDFYISIPKEDIA